MFPSQTIANCKKNTLKIVKCYAGYWKGFIIILNKKFRHARLSVVYPFWHSLTWQVKVVWHAL